MEEWKEYRLGEVCVKIGSGATPKGGKEAYLGGDISLIRSQNVLDFTFSNEGLAYINEEQADKLMNVEVKENDVLLNITGDSVARACIVPQSVLPARVNQHVAIIRGDESLVLNKFILYLLQYKKRYLLSISQGGATRNALTKKMIDNFDISLPPLPTQQKISNILSSLDDKIEVNRRINEQLEELAQALFKSWFVDFEPFKDGEFVESELGMIPEGWKVGTLGEVCNKITDGSHYSPKDNPKSNIPMLSVKDMQKYSFDYSKAKHIDEEEFAKMKSNDCVPLVNDILVAKDGSYLKEIFICKNEIKQAILSSIAIFRANKSIIYPIVLLCVLKSPRTLKNVSENYVSGSALPRIVLKDFKRYNIIIPPIDCQERFNDIISSIYDKIYANEEEITHLTNLRDTLLPKLMSGEIGVNDVEL